MRSHFFGDGLSAQALMRSWALDVFLPSLPFLFFRFVFLAPGWHVTRQAALRCDVAMPRGMVAARRCLACMAAGWAFVLCESAPVAVRTSAMSRLCGSSLSQHVPTLADAPASATSVKQASFARFLVRSFWAGMVIGRCSCQSGPNVEPRLQVHLGCTVTSPGPPGSHGHVTTPMPKIKTNFTRIKCIFSVIGFPIDGAIAHA